mmetsp:Transcript_53506/g.78131  ORF Transcript_53506/g.78131 Transcript_53506/m.78131 type:complete len:81 (+) Transcript_53506:996-1238(+)
MPLMGLTDLSLTLGLRIKSGAEMILLMSVCMVHYLAKALVFRLYPNNNLNCVSGRGGWWPMLHRQEGHAWSCCFCDNFSR